MRWHGLTVISVFLISFVAGCSSEAVKQKSLQEFSIPEEMSSHFSSKTKSKGNNVSLQFVKGKGFLKTTREDCEIRGGLYFGHKDALPKDMVDCAFPPGFRSLGIQRPKTLPQRQILGSVYDYLYRVAIEKPRYGLYSYVLFPTHTSRAESFLENLFKTTSFVELIEISFENLNINYIPTKADKISYLMPKIAAGSPPSVQLFAKQFYDYALAQQLLAKICTSPPEEIRDVCATDLSRGPYLFTFTHPASGIIPVPPPYLFVDLSNVHERAFAAFITAYKEQVKRSDYSDRERIDNFRLRILNIILTAADWIGPIKGAIADTVNMPKENSLR